MSALFACACGTEVAPGMLACPACHRLIHAEQLSLLAARAEALEAAGDLAGARALWREALDLLPASARQSPAIAARIESLNGRITPGLTKPSSGPDARPAWAKRAGPLGAIALFFWKIKVIAFFVLTKAKLLVLGLTKGTTLLSMLFAIGVYWTLWGWKFAAAFVAAMYVHEIGHVAALSHFGIRASAPMFVPGLGAFVRLHQYPQTPGEDARVGLAGPLWGLFASLAALGLWTATSAPLWKGVAQASGWLNLFNLLPVWQLDGGRGFRALCRWQRWVAAGALLALLLVTGETLLLVLAVVAAARALATAPEKPDHGMLGLYVFLAVALSFLSALHVPGAQTR